MQEVFNKKIHSRRT